MLYTLLQHGVETTVDRSQKNSRIINWIRHGQPNEVGLDEGDLFFPEVDCNATTGKTTMEDARSGT